VATPAIPAGHAPLLYTAELAMTPDDAISLFAELSLGLAGFAGVGSAFAGRTREFRGRTLPVRAGLRGTHTPAVGPG